MALAVLIFSEGFGPNHEEDFFKFCVLLRESELYMPNIAAVLKLALQ